MTEVEATITKLAGVAGALLSFKFINGSIPERIVMSIGGALLSYYGTPYAAHRTGLPEGLCGFLLGLFGMAVCARIYEAIRATDIGELIRWVFRK